MKSVLLSIIVIAAFASSSVWFEQAHASCMAENEISWNDVSSESELVFVGTVTRLDNYDGPQKVTFFIHDVVKGEINTPKYVLENTGMVFLDNNTIRSSSVSVDYKIGKTYKVYVTNGETNQCTTKITNPPADYVWEPEPETREELVDRYAEVAEKNTDAMKTRESLQQEIDDELKKPSPDIEIIEKLKKEIDEQTIIIQNTESELSSIQSELSLGLQMDPKLKLKLEKARDILRQNQKMIPWTGLGVSNSEQVVTISIDAENPEDYRKIIEDLIGKDIPVVIKKGGNPFLSNFKILSPLKQFKSGVPFVEIQCKDDLTLIQKHDGSPACVTLETKKKLVERGGVTCSDEIKYNRGHPCGVHSSPGISSDSLNLNIVGVEDGRISSYPANTCASLNLDRLTTQDIQRYKNDERGLNDTNILQITSSDLKEIPNIGELIYAVHSIEFPYNKYSSAYLDGMTFVEYELFLMDKSMKKYGDSKGDYFKQLDSDYEERFTNPAKQGFTNHFVAPAIIYNDDAYSVSGTYFWTSDEHNPRKMSFFPISNIEEYEKFITLTDEDMESVPKIKDAIESIGTITESIRASKGLSEDQQNQYREWFKQKSQDRLNSEKFRLIQYGEELYSVGFSIC